VPKEPEKDTQLQFALKLLRGEVTEPPAPQASEQQGQPAAGETQKQ